MNDKQSDQAAPRLALSSWCSWALSITLLCGCTSTPVEVGGTEQQVRDAVTEMLDAWQKGTSHSEYLAAHPDAVVADEEWQVGVPLKSYTIAAPAERSGGHWRQRVELNSGKRAKGNAATVYYAVTLSDKTVILRSDFNH